MTEYEKRLFDAVNNGDSATLRALLSDAPAGFDVTAAHDNNEFNLVWQSARQKNLETVRIIVENGFDFKKLEGTELAETSLTLVELMSGANDIELARLLLVHGLPADYTLYTLAGSPFKIEKDVIDLWLSHISAGSKQNGTSFFSYKDLIEANDTETIKALIEGGLNPNLQFDEEDDFHPIVECVRFNQWDLAKYFIAQGAKWPKIDLSVLKRVVKHTHTDKTGFDAIWINIYWPFGETDPVLPIHCAITFGEIEQVKDWLEAGNDPNLAFSTSQMSLLHLAVASNQKDVVELLIEKGADVNFESHMGKPIATGFYNENMVMIELLLKKGAMSTDQVWLLTNEDEGFAQNLSEDQIIEMLELCLKYGLNVYDGDFLVGTSRNDMLKVARWALEHGADPTKDESYDSEDPITGFTEAITDEMRELFQEFGFHE